MKPLVRACLLLPLLAAPALANPPPPRPLPLESFTLEFTNLDDYADHVFYLMRDGEAQRLEPGKGVALGKTKEANRFDRKPVTWQLFAVPTVLHDLADEPPDPAWFDKDAPVLSSPAISEEVPSGYWRQDAKAKRTYQVALSGDQLTVVPTGAADVAGRAERGGGGMGAALNVVFRWVVWVGVLVVVGLVIVVGLLVYFLRGSGQQPVED